MNKLFTITPLFLLILFSSCKKQEIKEVQKETVTDIDGNVYNTVTIGNQIWMTENLKVTRYRNGDPILKITNQTDWQNANTGAYCSYNNVDSNSKTYGYLYNWFSVGDSRKIAPAGWHIPTFEEWFTLHYFLGGQTVAGGKMKKTGIEYWISPNSGADNSSEFSALPGGIRSNLGGTSPFWGQRFYGFWWSTTEEITNTQQAHYRSLTHNSPFINWGILIKYDGLSIRCIKD